MKILQKVVIQLNRIPLRYSISNWHQLTECKSNNSRELHIEVTDFINDSRLGGIRITVSHETFGNLFTYVVSPYGSLVSGLGNIEYELSTNEILAQLAKFGYLITFKESEHLSGEQITYLMTLQNLGYDKIRILGVWKIQNGVKTYQPKVVVFKILEHPDWLNAGYVARESEFLKALDDGSAINITNISEANRYEWSWLKENWIAGIRDVIADNG